MPFSTTRRIEGAIALPAQCPVATAALIHVQVLDVSRADAASIEVGVTELIDVELAADALLPFALDVVEVPERTRLTLRVHIDLEGSGQVSVGDLVTTMYIPVPPQGPAMILAPVTVVEG